MSDSVESLLREAGVEFEVPGFMEKLGADAIYNGDLSSLGLEVNDNGELILAIALMEAQGDGEGGEMEAGGDGDGGEMAAGGDGNDDDEDRMPDIQPLMVLLKWWSNKVLTREYNEIQPGR